MTQVPYADHDCVVSQKVRILEVRVKGVVFVGTPAPTDPAGARVEGPAAPVWSSDPAVVMDWLCDGYRYRFNSLRAWRGRYAWEDDPDAEKPGARRKIADSAGEPILVALGTDPTWQSRAQARAAHPFLAAMPDLVLQAPERLENEEWFAAVKRRSTLKGKGRKPGGLPGFRRKHDDARFACWFGGGRNAVLTRTGHRSGIVTIAGANPVGWRGTGAQGRPLPAKWRIQIRVRLSQPIRDYTSIRVNWTTRELVFVNAPAPVSAVTTATGKPKRPTGSAVGLDLGVVRTIATSEGDFYDQPSTADLDAKIRRHQKAMSRSRRVNNPTNRKGQPPSNRARAHQRNLAKAYADKHNRLNDWRHKTTTDLVRRYDLIAVEDLNVKNMTRSARGTLTQPGVNVKAKSGLNRSLANAAFATIRSMLAYKTEALITTGADQHLIAVPPKDTSRRCNPTQGGCGHIAKANRKNQADFTCQRCGHTANADTNASGNVLDAAITIFTSNNYTLEKQGRTHDAVVAGNPSGEPVALAGSGRKADNPHATPAPSRARSSVIDGSHNEPRTTLPRTA